MCYTYRGGLHMHISLSKSTHFLISDLIEIACEDSTDEGAIKSFVNVVMEDCHKKDLDHTDWFELSSNARDSYLNRLLAETIG